MQFTALCFGPGLPAGGVRLACQLEAHHLRLTLPDGRQQALALPQAELRHAGFNDAAWTFTWPDGAKAWAVQVEDVAAQARMLRQPPAALKAAMVQMRAEQTRRTRHRNHLLLAAAIVCMVPLLLTLAVMINAASLTAWVARNLPQQLEERLGDEAFAAQSARLKLVEGTAANRALETIGARLTRGSRYPYHWHIARDPELNAFALPGGHVVVNTGLIAAADNAEELAGVIAHEVQHVELRHSLQGMVQQLGLSLTLRLVLDGASPAAEMAATLAGLKFSRDHEREADAEGLHALQQAGIAPQGMVSMFAKLQRQPRSGTPPAWLSTHPDTGDRIQSLQRAVAAAGPWPADPLSLDWSAVRESLGPP